MSTYISLQELLNKGLIKMTQFSHFSMEIKVLCLKPINEVSCTMSVIPAFMQIWTFIVQDNYNLKRPVGRKTTVVIVSAMKM